MSKYALRGCLIPLWKLTVKFVYENDSRKSLNCRLIIVKIFYLERIKEYFCNSQTPYASSQILLLNPSNRICPISSMSLRWQDEEDK
jgi:hypothetical protein